MNVTPTDKSALELDAELAAWEAASDIDLAKLETDLAQADSMNVIEAREEPNPAKPAP